MPPTPMISFIVDVVLVVLPKILFVFWKFGCLIVYLAFEKWQWRSKAM